jgi:hypothetical protein
MRKIYGPTRTDDVIGGLKLIKKLVMYWKDKAYLGLLKSKN